MTGLHHALQRHPHCSNARPLGLGFQISSRPKCLLRGYASTASAGLQPLCATQQAAPLASSTAHDKALSLWNSSLVQRRGVLLLGALAGMLGSAGVGPAKASKLPEAVDKGWEAMGGGPADLYFPEEFLGTWDVESVLMSVETPLGPEFVPDMAVVQRAQREDLKQRVRYQVEFMRNGRGQVVPDRRFNTASLMHTYTGQSEADVAQRIQWNPDDPNMLKMHLPGELDVMTRVMRRSEEQPAGDRLVTSEYFEQLIDSPNRARPKVKGSQCFTKYHWRSPEAAAADQGPLIVATQVVSDYLTGFDDPGLMMRAGNKPVTMYTYRMAFWRAAQ